MAVFELLQIPEIDFTKNLRDRKILNFSNCDVQFFVCIKVPIRIEQFYDLLYFLKNLFVNSWFLLAVNHACKWQFSSFVTWPIRISTCTHAHSGHEFSYLLQTNKQINFHERKSEGIISMTKYAVRFAAWKFQEFSITQILREINFGILSKF